MSQCIFCGEKLTPDTKPEHILLSALGGRMTTSQVICSTCNGKFGSTIDKDVGDQVATLRNLLLFDSGTGKPPPALRSVKAGADTINLKNDGTLELVAKPFTVTPLDNGQFRLEVTARSIEEIAYYLPHMAAHIGCSEEHLLQQFRAAEGRMVSRRPGVVHFHMPLGAGMATRSFVKSCLALWASLVGNAEMKSVAYDAARKFVTDDDEAFFRDRVHLDFRLLPELDRIKMRFGDLFNLIYVRGDDAGRVIGHFTLYNVIAWRFVLAERGGTSSRSIGLISNPVDPGTWSIAGDAGIEIDFAWLNSPDYPDEMIHAQQRLAVALRRSQENALNREIESITRTVFEKHGVTEGEAVTDPALQKKIVAEVNQRVAFHVMDLPVEDRLSGEELTTRVRAARGQAARE
jgi:hypothetical protein